MTGAPLRSGAGGMTGPIVGSGQAAAMAPSLSSPGASCPTAGGGKDNRQAQAASAATYPRVEDCNEGKIRCAVNSEPCKLSHIEVVGNVRAGLIQPLCPEIGIQCGFFLGQPVKTGHVAPGSAEQ